MHSGARVCAGEMHFLKHVLQNLNNHPSANHLGLFFLFYTTLFITTFISMTSLYNTSSFTTVGEVRCIFLAPMSSFQLEKWRPSLSPAFSSKYFKDLYFELSVWLMSPSLTLAYDLFCSQPPGGDWHISDFRGLTGRPFFLEIMEHTFAKEAIYNALPAEAHTQTNKHTHTY